jgi:hypothetical protein
MAMAMMTGGVKIKSRPMIAHTIGPRHTRKAKAAIKSGTRESETAGKLEERGK